jgi:hypothetical protein
MEKEFLNKLKSYKIPFKEVNESNRDMISMWKKEYDNDLSKINQLVAYQLLFRIAQDLTNSVSPIDFENESKSPTNHFQLSMYLYDIILHTFPFIYVDNNHKIIAKRTKIEVSDDDYNSIKELKEDDGESLDEKWSEKYKKSIDCNNPKGFSQKAHCQGRKKSENTESTTASSSGAYSAPAFSGPILKRDIHKFHNSNLSEALGGTEMGSYDVPFLGTTPKGRKNPLKIDGPDSIKKSRAVKDKNFPKWGGPGGIYIKIKEKCKKFPYCNQGDINAIEVLKESIDSVSKKYSIPKELLEEIVINEIKKIFI